MTLSRRRCLALLGSAVPALQVDLRAQERWTARAALRLRGEVAAIGGLLPPGLEVDGPGEAHVDVWFGGDSTTRPLCRVLVRASAKGRSGWFPAALWTADEELRWAAREGLGLPFQDADIVVARDGTRWTAGVSRAGSPRLALTWSEGSAEALPEATRDELLYVAYRFNPDWRKGLIDGDPELLSLAAADLSPGSEARPRRASIEWLGGAGGEAVDRLRALEPGAAWTDEVPPPTARNAAPARVANLDRETFEARAFFNYGPIPELGVRSAGRLDEAGLEALRTREEEVFKPVDIVEIDAMIGREAHAELLPPPCRSAGRPMIKILGIRKYGERDGEPEYAEIWLLAFCIAGSAAGWYALSRVAGSPAEPSFDRETYGHPTKLGDPDVSISPMNFLVSGNRLGREFFYAEGAFQGFATGISLGRFPVISLRAERGGASARLIRRMWHFQGRRNRVDPKTLAIEFPAGGGERDFVNDRWFQVGPIQPASASAMDGAAWQRGPGEIVAEVADFEPYYRERCDGLLPWEPADRRVEPNLIFDRRPATRS